jgi:HD-GYP domain-containing protein (c-di-GMP phosphodiesterase class II)
VISAATVTPVDPRLIPSPRRVLVYAVVLATAAVSAGAALVATGYPFGPVPVVIGLAVIAAIAERGTVRLSSTLEESISAIPMLFAAVLFGPLAALVVAAASMLGDFTRPYLRWGIYTSSRSLTAMMAGGTAAALSSLTGSHTAAIAMSTLAAAVLAQVLDALFAATTIHLRRTGRMSETIRELAPIAAAAIPLYAPLVALLALAYDQVSPWTVMLFFVPALAAQRLYSMYHEQRNLTIDLTQANLQLEKANLSFASALVATLDARDRYTAGHSAAVAIYSRDIAARMGLSQDDQHRVYLSGLVHDIGKIGLAPALLEKAGPLTLDERRQMQEHSTIGERILAKVDDYFEIANVVRSHHERVDGEGYPDGLRADEIPLLARIIAVADAYNAMTSDRPYRDAMPSRVARLRLAQAVESQFDTSVVAAFEAILTSANAEYRSGTSPEFNHPPGAAEEPPSVAAAVA